MSVTNSIHDVICADIVRRIDDKRRSDCLFIRAKGSKPIKHGGFIFFQQKKNVSTRSYRFYGQPKTKHCFAVTGTRAK